MPPKQEPSADRLANINKVLSNLQERIPSLTEEARNYVTVALNGQKTESTLKAKPNPGKYAELSGTQIDNDTVCVYGMRYSTAHAIITLELSIYKPLFFEEHYLAKYIINIPTISNQDANQTQLKVGRNDPVVDLDPFFVGLNKIQRLILTGDQVLAYYDLAKRLIRFGLPPQVHTMIENDITQYDPRRVPAKSPHYEDLTDLGKPTKSFVTWEAFRCAQLGMIHPNIDMDISKIFSVEKVVIFKNKSDYVLRDIYIGVQYPCTEITRKKKLKFPADLEYWKKQRSWPESGSQPIEPDPGTGKKEHHLGDLTDEINELKKGSQKLKDRLAAMELQNTPTGQKDLKDYIITPGNQRVTKEAFEDFVKKKHEVLDQLFKRHLSDYKVKIEKWNTFMKEREQADLEHKSRLNTFGTSTTALTAIQEDHKAKMDTLEKSTASLTKQIEKQNTSLIEKWDAFMKDREPVDLEHESRWNNLSKSSTDMTTIQEKHKAKMDTLEKSAASSIKQLKKQNNLLIKQLGKQQEETNTLKEKITALEETLDEFRSTYENGTWSGITKSVGRQTTRIRGMVQSPIAKKIAMVMGAAIGTYYVGSKLPYTRWGRKAALMIAESVDTDDLVSIINKMGDQDTHLVQVPTGMEME